MDLSVIENKVFIPKSNINETHSLVLRVFDSKSRVIDYKSTRLGTITADNTGVSFECDEKFIGCEFEIKDLQTVQSDKTTITGKFVKGKVTKASTEKESKKDE